MDTVLLVEDDDDEADIVTALLRREKFDVLKARTGEDAVPLLARDVGVVIADVHLGGGMSGLELCKRVRELAPHVPVIMVTGAGRLDVAIEAIRVGAYDFVVKPVAPEALMAAVGRAAERTRMQTEIQRLRREAEYGRSIDGMLGESSALRDVIALIRRIARSDATVLIQGESGTGKERASRAVHDYSGRSHKPFVAVNCAAVPAALLESELFGHVKGAFTDARRDRSGLFLQAQGGTLFLDEIGEMPIEMQAKLLRVLQERRIRPVGGEEEVQLDVRFVFATNRDLESEVEAKRFREDLYYRINVVGIRVPALRDRGSDTLLLASHFLRKIHERSQLPELRISSDAARKLMDYDWPGNVRELENCMERAAALCAGEEITVGDLPEKVQAYAPTRLVVGGVGDRGGEDLITLSEMERRYVRQVLASVGGNKSQAARILGIDRRSLYRRVESSSSVAQANRGGLSSSS